MAGRPYVIVATGSAVLDAASPVPPEFTLTVVGTPLLAVEVSPSPSFDSNAGYQPLRYFSSQVGLGSVRPVTLRPSDPGPAGTRRISYLLPHGIWRTFVRDGATRLYYRALAYDRLDNGKPAGTVAYSWQPGSPDVPSPPFLFVRQAQATVDGAPASRPFIGLADLDKLALDNGQLTIVGAKPSVGSTPKTLRGVNLSQLQHRQFNWGVPYSGPVRPVVGQSPKSEPKCPDPSTRFHVSAGITRELIEQLRRWEVRVVRLPILQDWVLNGATPRACERAAPLSAEEYLRDVDQVIAWLAGEGVYTLLCLHSLRRVPLTCSRDGDLYQGHLPDELSAVCWALLNARYRSSTAVLFDLFNEPHATYQGDQFASCYTGIVPTGTPTEVRDGWVELWHDRVREIAAHLHDRRTGNPDRLLFVSGFYGAGWSASLRHMPVRELVSYGRDAPGASVSATRRRTKSKYGQPLPNLVYCGHLYCDYCDNGHSGDDPDHWLDIGADEIGDVPPNTGTTRLPVFVAEWGPSRGGLLADGSWSPDPTVGAGCPGAPPRTQEQRVRTLAKKLTGHRFGTRSQLVGWTAWAIGDGPYLDLRDVRDLTSCLDQAAQDCVADFWQPIAHCKPTPQPTHPYLVTRNDERVPTAWGEVVRTALTS